MKRGHSKKDHKRQVGQSLTEVAIFLPILILIIAGIVEISNLLNTQNKLTTAARIAAGYGAANYDREQFIDSTAVSMGEIAVNTVADTLDLDDDRWDIWSVAARTNITGTGFNFFTYTQVYGTNQVVTPADWNSDWPDIRDDILTELRIAAGCDPEPNSQCVDAEDIEVVASVPFFKSESLIGLPVSEWMNMDKMRGLTVMRVDTPPTELAGGCPLLPIAVRIDQWTLYPSDWLEDTGEVDIEPPWTPYTPTLNLFPGHDVQPFPPNDRRVWEYPDCEGGCDPDEPAIQQYDNLETAPDGLLSTQLEWRGNIPGYSLRWLIDNNNFPQGYIFWAREEPDLGGNFGWLTWDGAPSSDALRDSLGFPYGNFINTYPFSRADMGDLLNINPPGPSGNGDHWLEVGEWVEGAPGNKDVAGKQGVQTFVFNEEITSTNRSTPVAIIVFDELNDDSGSNTNYRVAGFVLVRILGYSFGGNVGGGLDLYGGKWIVFELLGPATKCYQIPPDTNVN